MNLKNEIRIGTRQMNGLWNMSAYQSYIDAMVSPDVDKQKNEVMNTAASGHLRTISSSMKDGLPSLTITVLHDKATHLAEMETQLVNDEIDTTRPWVWINLHMMITEATALSLIPDFGVGTADGMSTARALISDVATWVDILCRLADEDLRSTVSGIVYEKTAPSQVKAIYNDIICGRSAAWLSYVDALGRQAAMLSDEVWEDAFDTVAAFNFNELVHFVADMQNMTVDRAGRAVVIQAMMLGQLFDRSQLSAYEMTRERGGHCAMPRPSLRRESLRADTLADFRGFAFKSGPDGLSGWCDVFQKHPVDCVMSLPSGVSTNVYKAYSDTQKKIEEADA